MKETGVILLCSACWFCAFFVGEEFMIGNTSDHKLPLQPDVADCICV